MKKVQQRDKKSIMPLLLAWQLWLVSVAWLVQRVTEVESELASHTCKRL